jgi:Domain of unknown function (DUF397)
MAVVTPTHNTWRKSSRCNHGECVEVGEEPASCSVVIRDSKNGGGPQLTFSHGGWRRFIREIQALAALAALSAAAVLLLLTVR